MSINIVMIEGRVGSDPAHYIFKNGGQVCSFSFAHNQYWRDKNGEPKSKVIWIKVKGFDKMAEVFRDKCSKGKRLILSGSLDLNTWQDKETGKNNSQIELLAQNVRFLESSSGSVSDDDGEPLDEPSSLKNTTPKGSQGPKFTTVDIPF